MATATYVTTDATTGGHWVDVYGQDGAIVGSGDNTAVEDPGFAAPAYLSSFPFASVTGNVYDQHSTAAIAIDRPSGPDGWYGAWYRNDAITQEVTVDQPCRLAILYWDSDSNRTADVDILDSDGATVLASASVSDFTTQVKWLVFDVSGHFYVRTTKTGGANVVVTGYWFGPYPVGPASAGYLCAFGRGGLAL